MPLTRENQDYRDQMTQSMQARRLAFLARRPSLPFGDALGVLAIETARHFGLSLDDTGDLLSTLAPYMGSQS